MCFCENRPSNCDAGPVLKSKLQRGEAMKISRIALDNFKGQNVDHAVGPLTLFVGPNGSGKTARLEAVSFAVTGQVPGKSSPRASADVITGAEGSAKVGLDTEFGWERGIRRSGDSTKQFIGITDRASADGVWQFRQVATKAGEQELSDKVGCFAPMFDLSLFLKLTDEKKRQFILDLYQGGSGSEDTPQQVQDDVRVQYLVRKAGSLAAETVCNALFGCHMDDLPREKVPELLVALERSDTDSDEVRSLVSKIVTETVCAAGFTETGQLEACAKAIGLIDARRNKIKADAQAADKTVQQLVDSKRELQTVAESLEDLKAAKAKLVASSNDIASQLAMQDGRDKSVKSLESGIDTLSTNRETLVTAHADKLAEVARLKAAVGNEPEEVPAEPSREQLDALKGDQLDVVSHVADTNAIVQSCRAFLTHESEKHGMLVAAQESQSVMQELTAVSMRIFEATLVDGRIFQRFGHRLLDEQDDVWADIVRLKAIVDAMDVIGECDRRAAEITDCEQAIATKKTVLQDAIEKADHAKMIRARLAENIRNETSRLETATTEWNEKDESRERWEKATNNLEMAETVAAGMKERVVERDVDLAQKRKELAELLADGETLNVAKMKQQKSAIDSQVATLETQIDHKTRLSQVDAEIQRARLAAQISREDHAVAVNVALAFRAVREGQLRGVVAPIVDRISTFTHGVFGFDAYCDLETPDGSSCFKIGMVKPTGQKCSFDTLSGGERAVFATGLSAAIVSQNEAPLKVLMIEGGEIDRSNMERVLAACETLYEAGDLSNILVSSWHSPFPSSEVSEKWVVHYLGASETYRINPEDGGTENLQASFDRDGAIEADEVASRVDPELGW